MITFNHDQRKDMAQKLKELGNLFFISVAIERAISGILSPSSLFVGASFLIATYALSHKLLE